MTKNHYEALKGESIVIRETKHILNTGRLVTVKCGFIGTDRPLTLEVMDKNNTKVF